MSQAFQQFSGVLHDKSLPTIAFLQQSFPSMKNSMISVSTALDPRYVFLIYAPILFALNKAVGHRMIIALTLTEWSNQVLKWMLAGERPYWYVLERNLQLSSSSQANETSASRQFAPLVQFPVTCEMGAGSPSGHAMVTSTVWYILIEAYLKKELSIFNRNKAIDEVGGSNNNKANKTLNALAKCCWISYATMLVLISLSRVYLACHFPHQCLTGALLGIAIARLVSNKLQMKLLRQSYFALFTVFMFCTALGTYAILKSNGFNPMWTVDKATKWCTKKEYLHMDTTPFFSMMRYLGFCLGTGLAFNYTKLTSQGKSASKKWLQSLPALACQRIIQIALSIYFGQLLLSLPLPNKNIQVFYAFSFLVYVVFSYSIAAPIPRLAKAITKNAVQTVTCVRDVLKMKQA